MQGGRHKLTTTQADMNHDNRQPLLGRIHPLAAIFILSPFILYAIALLLPTFDDWSRISLSVMVSSSRSCASEIVYPSAVM